MRRAGPGIFSVFLLIAFASCVTPGKEPSPEPSVFQASPAVSPVPSPTATPAPSPPSLLSPTPESSFDPSTISAEMKHETLVDVADLIQELNRITQEKRYDAWLTFLTPDFIEKYSSVEFLGRLSEAPILKRQKISLGTLKDYFDYVVYPSHQNDRVDDIDFIGHNRVKAITLNAKKERLVLWDLEKVGNTWKIGIGR